MTITDRLIKLDPTLEIYNEGKWHSPYDRSEIGYTSFNDAGVECEVGEFLYSTVRILKPKRILETGTHWGISAAYMGMALSDNNEGLLDTFEILPEIHRVAIERIRKIGLLNRVSCHLQDVATFDGDLRFQMMFLDTEPILRFAELVKFFPRLDEGGYIFIHDTPRNLCQGNVNADHPEISSWPFGDIPDQMREWVKNGEMKAFHFGTPRGMVGFYKTHKDDVKW